MMFEISLSEVRKFSPCQDGWHRFLKATGKTKADNEVINPAIVMQTSCIDDAIWMLKAIPQFHVPDTIFNALCAKHIPLPQREDMLVRLCEGRLSESDVESLLIPPPDFREE